MVIDYKARRRRVALHFQWTLADIARLLD